MRGLVQRVLEASVTIAGPVGRDLVGSIANESGLSGKQIGPIRISEHFAVVGVPETAAENVIAVMRKTMIKGKKVTVRRFIEDPQ